MLGNLKNLPEPFEDIIRTHFRFKARSIRAQLDRWLAQDDGKPTAGDGAVGLRGSQVGPSGNGFQADIDELKRILSELQGESDTVASTS